MEAVIYNNAIYYKYSENGIKERNFELWKKVSSYIEGDVSFKEKFYLYEKSMLSVPKCYCGNRTKFTNMTNGFKKFCSRECMYNDIDTKNTKKKTCLDKYGVDNPSKSTVIKDRVKETNNIKYGVDHPLQSNDILEKSKTLL